MKKVIIIGGGAAGMAAAVFLAEGGCAVTLYEKNEKLGKKVYITGKGRCNFTNVCDPADFLNHVISNKKFLFSSIYGFTSSDTMELFERLGLKTKVERGNRAFPVSDHASDVIKALSRRMEQLGVEVHLNSEVREIPMPGEDQAVIIATGGLSYPSTGSTGDGYRFAKETGHAVTATRPALVPLAVKEEDIPQMQGLSLKNVRLVLKNGKKTVFDEFGEMLFTHYGISGPLGISASSYAGKILENTELTGSIDLKPALDEEKLDARLLREFENASNKYYKNVIQSLLPSKMIPVFISRTGIEPERPVHSISKGDRRKIIETLKHFVFTAVSTGGYNEAVITQGGVSVKDIDPKTMESRHVPGLYFIGEVLDVDALTGGYNLQIAWSTAYAAAQAIIEDN